MSLPAQKKPATVWGNTQTAHVAEFIDGSEIRCKRAFGMAVLAIEQAGSYSDVHDEEHGNFPPLDKYLLGRSLRGWLSWRLTTDVRWQDDDREDIEALRRELVEAALKTVDWDGLAESVLDRFGQQTVEKLPLAA